MSLPVLSFAYVSLLVVLLDQASTYYFTKPSQTIFNDPGRYERNRILRHLLRRFGLRGQLLYAPLEFLVVLAMMSIIYFIVLNTAELVLPGGGWAFDIALLVPIVDLAIVLPLNYWGGRKIRQEKAKT